MTITFQLVHIIVRACPKGKTKNWFSLPTEAMYGLANGIKNINNTYLYGSEKGKTLNCQGFLFRNCPPKWSDTLETSP